MRDWLGLENLEVDDVADLPHQFQITATASAKSACPRCLTAANATFHAWRTKTVTDMPMRGKPTRLVMKIARWMCSCSKGKTFSAHLQGVHPTLKATVRLIRYIENQTTKRPLADIARETGISSTTVGELAITLSKNLDAHHRFPTPRVFSIDGIKLNDRDNMVFSDAITGHAIGFIESIEATRVRGWLRAHIDASEVQIFVSDLHLTNLSIARKPLGHALHVADKFHLVKDFQQCLSRVVSKRLDDLRRFYFCFLNLPLHK